MIDRSPLSPELELLLSDYQIYLQQWSYRSVSYRIAIARDFLRGWNRPMDQLTLQDWQTYGQQQGRERGSRLFAFRRFLEETGRWRAHRPGPEERAIPELPTATAQWVLAYLRRRKRQGQSFRHRTEQRRGLLHFLTRLPAAQRADLTQVTCVHLEAYIELQQDQGLTPRTINNRLSQVRGFFDWLCQQRVYPGPVPVYEDHYLRQPDPVPRALHPEDVRALLGAIDHPLHRAVLLVLLRTGMRGGELIQLRLADVDLEQATLVVRQGGKNQRGRVVYLSKDAHQALSQWLQQRPQVPCDRLFFTPSSHGLSIFTIREWFLSYLKQAAVQRPYRVHDLRHTFATDLLNAGVPVTTLQELLGHQSLAVTQRYARVADQTKRAHYFAAMGRIQQQEPHRAPRSREERDERTAC